MSQQNGFTILELLVTIFIIILLSSALFASTRQSDQEMTVMRAARAFAQVLREAEEMSMAAESANCPGGGSITRIFGVNIKQEAGSWENAYRLFADCDNDKFFDESSDAIIETFPIGKGVRVSAARLCPGCSNQTSADIVFEPPHPLIYLNAGISQAEMQIFFRSDDNAIISRKVKINTAGRIEIEKVILPPPSPF